MQNIRGSEPPEIVDIYEYMNICQKNWIFRFIVFVRNGICSCMFGGANYILMVTCQYYFELIRYGVCDAYVRVGLLRMLSSLATSFAISLPKVLMCALNLVLLYGRV